MHSIRATKRGPSEKKTFWAAAGTHREAHTWPSSEGPQFSADEKLENWQNSQTNLRHLTHCLGPYFCNLHQCECNSMSWYFCRMAPSSTLKLCAAVPMPIENFPECHRERTRFSGEFSAAGRVFRANKAKQKHTQKFYGSRSMRKQSRCRRF